MNAPHPQSHVVFLLNLLQDVNISRPLIFMASRNLRVSVTILVSESFYNRDYTGTWRREIEEIAQATNADVSAYGAPADALRLLDGRGGAIVAASESNLRAHFDTHDIMLLAGPNYRKITLQHGLECVGFRQSREHDLAHGTNVKFGADTLCGWLDGSQLSSMLSSERPKLVVTGPTALLQRPQGTAEPPSSPIGLVCENLHSARFRMTGDLGAGFLETFGEFCGAMAQRGRDVVLRPHPGGQYVVKNEVAFPPNVRLNNHPMYKVDLRRYAYGISAPSSILVDMVLAGIPTAVWHDAGDVMDASGYGGLAEVQNVQDWLAFAQEVETHPERFRERQAAFIARLGIPTNPADVARRFADLFRAAINEGAGAFAKTRSNDGIERVLFVANSNLPSLQISFERPLAPLVAEGRMKTLLIDDLSAARMFPKGQHALAPGQEWARRQFEQFKPTIVVFCRYSGCYHELFLDLARERGVPTLMHVDDDLLGIPENFGEAKYKFHNDPARLKALRDLLSQSDLVYCSTPKLQQRMKERGIDNKMRAGLIYCPGVVFRRPELRPLRRIGYTGFREKLHELEMVASAISRFMVAHPDVRLDLVGDLPVPEALQHLGGRVVCRPPIRDYNSFLSVIDGLQWDVGICPLELTPFNMVKADTKWVEYTSIGTAVVASRGTVYDGCCADGRGVLADGEDEWLAAFEILAQDPSERVRLVEQAQARLKVAYSPSKLTEQVLGMIDEAKRAREEARRSAA